MTSDRSRKRACRPTWRVSRAASLLACALRLTCWISGALTLVMARHSTSTRPLNRNQHLENAAFLKVLRRTGNIREAARQVGLKYSTVQHRRAKHPPFALKVEQALVFARARLAAKGKQGPVGAGDGAAALRTRGGEPVIVALKSGALQMRRAHPGKVTRAAEQAFLAALAVTANISLSAAAVGVAEAAFHRRRRTNPAFAREMRWALAEGCARLTEALIAGFLPQNHEDDSWRHNDGPAPPRLVPRQALQLLYLHQKAATIGWEALSRRRRPHEPDAVHQAEVVADYHRRVKRDAEDERREQLDALAARLPPSPHEVPPPTLPDLDQVTGWSRADVTKEPHGDRALFGGWRVEHLTPEQRAAGAEARRWGKRG